VIFTSTFKDEISAIGFYFWMYSYNCTISFYISETYDLVVVVFTAETCSYFRFVMINNSVLTDCNIIAYYTDTLVMGALLRHYKELQVAREDY
jgi:hypothetical protein